MKLSVLAVALAAVAELPAPALADRPTRSPVPLGTVTVTDVCELPVLIEEIVNPRRPRRSPTDARSSPGR